MKIRYAGNAPVQQTAGAAGLDLKMDLQGESDVLWLLAGERKMIPTGTYIEIPEGYVGFLAPRSGLANNQIITVLNSPGVIDSDYRGEIKVMLINHSGESKPIKDGDRIGQLVIVPTPEIELEKVSLEELSKTERGDGGFGSTGA